MAFRRAVRAAVLQQKPEEASRESTRDVVLRQLAGSLDPRGSRGKFGGSFQEKKFAVSTLPYLNFASGHTFFTQSLQKRWNVSDGVCAVHTTFQFGDTAEFTWGKRSRLREARLWAVDDESYFRGGSGQSAHAAKGGQEAEGSFSNFLQLTGTLGEWHDVLERLGTGSYGAAEQALGQECL